jgi:hypothetical protein
MFWDWIENNSDFAEGHTLKIKYSFLLLLDWQRFCHFQCSRCIKWHLITLQKNKILINYPMINGNMVCKFRCVLDRIHSLERSKDRRIEMFYRRNSAANNWRYLLKFFHTHFLAPPPPPLRSLSLARFLCRPTRAV